MPAHFLHMVRAEVRMVFVRRSGMVAVGVAIAVGLAALLAMNTAHGWANREGVSFNGLPIEALVQFNGPEVAAWALRMRNFFVLPIVLLLATGACVAGELSDHTMRELLVRPVPRWSVLAAKVIALLVLSWTTLVATLAPALLGGVALFGAEGRMVDVLLGYAASLASDLGLIAIGVLASVFLRGVAGVVVGVVLLLMVDLAARGVLAAAGFAGISGAKEISALLPGSALACWEGWSAGWEVQPFVGLLVLIGVCFGLAALRFHRMDVP